MSMPISEINFEEGLARGQEVLEGNGYPGRWLAVGRGEGTHADRFYMAYSFGGRSEGSKNRQAVFDGEAVRLIAPGMTPEEMAKKADAALVYYHASDAKDGVFVVSNGAQTRPVLGAVVAGASFEQAVINAPTVKGMMDGEEVDIDLSSFEPDAPINTPRITGLLDLREEAITPFGLAVVRKNPETSQPIRSFVTGSQQDLKPGEGWAIQTYAWNDPSDRETPVPHFDQMPYGFDMSGDVSDIAARVQEAIGEQTFAAAVVRAIDIGRREFAEHQFINTRG